MSDMLNALIQADAALLIGALVILLAYIALAAIGHLRRKYANPGLDAILNALTPFLYRAIVAGERAALQGLRDADAILTGADKAAIANRLYALLPDTIMVGKIPVPVSRIKALVPRYLFAEWIKDAYDATHAFLIRNEEYLQAQIRVLEPAVAESAADELQSPTDVDQQQQRAA
jgi:hypothetical protein